MSPSTPSDPAAETAAHGASVIVDASLPLAGGKSPRGPVVVVDGQPRQHRWGRVVVPVAPGRHHLRVYAPYLFLRRFGAATYTVDVARGQQAVLQYRTPVFILSRGSLGPPPQPTRGTRATLWAVLISVLVVAAVSVLPAVVSG